MRNASWAAALIAAISVPALADPPSAECRDTAQLCREAFTKLEQCETTNPGQPEACASERAAVDSSCRASASACDRDGSKRSPK